jgi:hypothetical protein
VLYCGGLRRFGSVDSTVCTASDCIDQTFGQSRSREARTRRNPRRPTAARDRSTVLDSLRHRGSRLASDPTRGRLAPHRPIGLYITGPLEGSLPGVDLANATSCWAPGSQLIQSSRPALKALVGSAQGRVPASLIAPREEAS